jgi:hypothetical protein
VASTWIRIGSLESMPAARSTQKEVAKHSIEKRRTQDLNRVRKGLLEENSLRRNYKIPRRESYRGLSRR